MILHSLLEDKTTIKYQFDPTQVRSISSILQKIIAKESNSSLKNRFQNLDGLFRGKYKSLESIQKATKGVRKMFLEVSSLKEDIQENSKNKKLKLIIKIIVVLDLIALVGYSSKALYKNASQEKIYKEYGSNLTVQPDTSIFYIKLSDEELNKIYTILNEYLSLLDEKVLNNNGIYLSNKLKDNIAGEYNSFTNHISINKNALDKEEYLGTIVHEKSHSKQHKGKFLLGLKGYSTKLGYYLNPMEIDARFNNVLALAKNNKNIGRDINILDSLILLLTYRPEYDYSKKDGISKNDVLLVHKTIKGQFPTAYKKYLEIKDDPKEIKKLIINMTS